MTDKKLPNDLGQDPTASLFRCILPLLISARQLIVRMHTFAANAVAIAEGVVALPPVFLVRSGSLARSLCSLLTWRGWPCGFGRCPISPLLLPSLYDDGARPLPPRPGLKLPRYRDRFLGLLSDPERVLGLLWPAMATFATGLLTLQHESDR
jgi:hypothetical protein